MTENRDSTRIESLINLLNGAGHLGEAMDMMAQIGGPAVLPLISILNARNDLINSKNGLLFPRIAYVLSLISDERAIKPLINMVKDEDYEWRSTAAFCLARMGEPGLFSLINLFKDKDGKVRAVSVRAAGNLIDSRIVTPLIEALKDEYEEVRYWAANSLGNFVAEDAIGPLTELLEDSDELVRREANYAIERIQQRMKENNSDV